MVQRYALTRELKQHEWLAGRNVDLWQGLLGNTDRVSLPGRRSARAPRLPAPGRLRRTAPFGDQVTRLFVLGAAHLHHRLQ